MDLEICATHLSLEQLEADIDWVIAYHKLWNCAYIGIGAMPAEYRDNLEEIRTFAEKCNALGEKLLKNGQHLIYHNHKFEFEKFEDKTIMEHLFELSNPDFVQFELDTYWVQAGGASPVDWIYKVNNRMDVIHFKDFRIIKDEQQFAELGQENLDWPTIIKAFNILKPYKTLI